jgi:hypothetical protein
MRLNSGIFLGLFFIASVATANAQATIQAAPPGSPRCEWVPKVEERPAAGAICGFNDVGLPNNGIYECGVRQSGNRCVPFCVFRQCARTF